MTEIIRLAMDARRSQSQNVIFGTERRLAITWLFNNGRRIYSEPVLTVLISPMKVRCLAVSTGRRAHSHLGENHCHVLDT